VETWLCGVVLRGDPSDKLPGARGVGAKRAAALLAQFGSLEPILAVGQFADQAEDLKLFKKLATMDASVPLVVLQDQKSRWDQAAGLAGEWGLDRLARRLEELACTRSA
jgi:DNA polymerase I